MDPATNGKSVSQRVRALEVEVQLVTRPGVQVSEQLSSHKPRAAWRADEVEDLRAVSRFLSLAQEPSRGETRPEVTGERSSQLESCSVFFKQRPRDFLNNSATDFDNLYNSGTEPEINVSTN